MPGDPHECRENAKRCLEMAQTSRTRLGKEKFQGLAQNWLALATHYRAANMLLAKWSDFPRATRTIPPTFCRDAEADQLV